jgi:hypothetical protein
MKRPSVNEARKAELEAELAIQKERFMVASRRGMDAVKTDLSIMNWLRAYPREAAILIVIGGFVASRLIRARRSQQIDDWRKQPDLEVA